jgi:hypothetical protein
VTNAAQYRGIHLHVKSESRWLSVAGTARRCNARFTPEWIVQRTHADFSFRIWLTLSGLPRILDLP